MCPRAKDKEESSVPHYEAQYQKAVIAGSQRVELKFDSLYRPNAKESTINYADLISRG